MQPRYLPAVEAGYFRRILIIVETEAFDAPVVPGSATSLRNVERQSSQTAEINIRTWVRPRGRGINYIIPTTATTRPWVHATVFFDVGYPPSLVGGPPSSIGPLASSYGNNALSSKSSYNGRYRHLLKARSALPGKVIALSDNLNRGVFQGSMKNQWGRDM